MKTYWRCVLTGCCLLAGYGLLIWGFGLVNLPSDRSLYAGLAIVVGLIVVLPVALRAIWRNL